jgi:cardiolipin synthase
MNRSDLPNVISVFRIVLVAPVMWLILEREFTMALIMFLVAGVSDGVDGYLAKRYGWISRLGTILDPLADKLLLTGSYLMLWWIDMLPLWLVVAIIMRDILIVGGGLAYHVLVGQYEMAPTLVSKANTAAQILLVLAVLSDALLPIAPMVLATLVYVVLVTTIVSGIDYIWTWGTKAVQARRRQAQGQNYRP